MEGLKPTHFLINKLLVNPELVGVSKEVLDALPNPQQKIEVILGEYYWLLYKECGSMAADYMMKAEWSHGVAPEQFDQRMQFMMQEQGVHDHFLVTVGKALENLPLDGTILDLCCGNGYMDWAFFAPRASKLVGVDYNKHYIDMANQLHKRANCSYELANVLEFDMGEATWDMIYLRGTVARFTLEEQHKLLTAIAKACKPTGCFCGDSTLALGNQQHKHEWATKDEALEIFTQYFKLNNLSTMASRDRSTLFWVCSHQ